MTLSKKQWETQKALGQIKKHIKCTGRKCHPAGCYKYDRCFPD